MRVPSSPAPLLGLAVGDALGMPFETETPDNPHLLQWQGEFQASTYHGLSPGQWTDDTMMSKLLAESLLHKGGYDPNHVSQLYREWLESGDLRGMGKSTKSALVRLGKGHHWSESGEPGAEGNGTAMRAAPIGIFFRSQTDLLIEAACLDSKITHRSEEAEEGSIAIALAVALLANGAPKELLASEVAQHLRDSEVRRGVLKVDFYVRTNGIGPTEALRLIGTKARVTQTVPAALAAFVLTRSYLDAITTAIRAGGDTDTTAAVTGALAGTFYGHEAVVRTGLTENLESVDDLMRLDAELQSRSRVIDFCPCEPANLH